MRRRIILREYKTVKSKRWEKRSAVQRCASALLCSRCLWRLGELWAGFELSKRAQTLVVACSHAQCCHCRGPDFRKILWRIYDRKFIIRFFENRTPGQQAVVLRNVTNVNNGGRVKGTRVKGRCRGACRRSLVDYLKVVFLTYLDKIWAKAILCLSDAFYVPELTEKSRRRGNHCTRSFTQFYG